MKTILTAIFLIVSFSLQAAAPPRGDDRLRELVVFPEINLTVNWGITSQNDEWEIARNIDLPGAIAGQREELKRQPDDVQQLLRLGNLLDENDETNESRIYYQNAEQLSRDKIAIDPQDGLSWTALGRALDSLGQNAEAENAFRKATLVSSNEWQCWVGLGDFLEGDSFSSLFSDDIRNIIAPGQMPSQAVLDYHPTPIVLEKAESLCREASRCFDRAIAVAPGEPDIFLQRAGFMSISNSQNCYLRYYRDNEKITTNEWVFSFFSPETIANLKRAAGLKPKDYQYVSLAAYFEYWVPMMQAEAQPGSAPFTPDDLPEKTRQSIRQAMTRLENLSSDPDNKIAAGALENAGFLNMMFGNKPVALADFRRAVVLDPTREQSWDLLLITLSDSPDKADLLAVCRARLKVKDSARNHLILSKILTRMNKWKEAAEQAEMANQLETNNIIPPIMLAAIALKQSDQQKYQAFVKTSLEYAHSLLEKNPPDKETPERARELFLNAAISDIFMNQPQEAANFARTVLKNFPTDPVAAEILKDAEASQNSAN